MPSTHFQTERSFSWIEFVQLIPNPTIFQVALITAIFGLLYFVAIIASPTRMIASLDREIEHASKHYVEMVETHLLDCRDVDICEQFLALDDKARKLRIKTLSMRLPALIWWSSGLYGILSGHSFAVWRCTGSARSLANKLQLMVEGKTRDLNIALAVGSSPSRQLWLRYRGASLTTRNL